MRNDPLSFSLYAQYLCMIAIVRLIKPNGGLFEFYFEETALGRFHDHLRMRFIYLRMSLLIAIVIME